MIRALIVFCPSAFWQVLNGPPVKLKAAAVADDGEMQAGQANGYVRLAAAAHATCLAAALIEFRIVWGAGDCGSGPRG